MRKASAKLRFCLSKTEVLIRSYVLRIECNMLRKICPFTRHHNLSSYFETARQ